MLSPRELGADVSSVTERILIKAMDLRQESRYPDVRSFWSQLRESIFTRRDRGPDQLNKKKSAAGKKKKIRLLPAAVFIAAVLAVAAGNGHGGTGEGYPAGQSYRISP